MGSSFSKRKSPIDTRIAEHTTYYTRRMQAIRLEHEREVESLQHEVHALRTHLDRIRAVMDDF
jgi:hypothetical protein